MADVERSGKHAAPRHAAQPAAPARIDSSRLDPLGSGAPGEPPHRSSVLFLALGITAAVVAWGYLVYLAIDFGTAARDGDGTGWWMLALATIGAIACLFVGMLLGARFVAALRRGAAPATPPRPPGGRRAAR
jgi:hypothetical protein